MKKLVLVAVAVAALGVAGCSKPEPAANAAATNGVELLNEEAPADNFSPADEGNAIALPDNAPLPVDNAALANTAG